MKGKMRPTRVAWVVGILGSVLSMNVDLGRAAEQESHPSVWAFVGTYTQGDSRGIYAVSAAAAIPCFSAQSRPQEWERGSRGGG